MGSLWQPLLDHVLISLGKRRHAWRDGRRSRKLQKFIAAHEVILDEAEAKVNE